MRRLKPTFRLLPGAVFLCAACWETAAVGAPCCVSATSFGIGRLLIWEDFAVGLQTGHSRVMGEWDRDAALRKNPRGYREGVSQVQPWAIVRLKERFELQGWLPFIVNDRWFTGTRQVAGGVGDAGLAGRYQLVDIGEFESMPSLALTLGVLAPTGRRVEETRPPLFAGATGRGAWGGFVAVETEYARIPWFVNLRAAGTLFAPFTRPDTGKTQRYGALMASTLAAGREIGSERVVTAVAVSAEWQDSIAIQGSEVPASQAHLYTLAASVSWRADPHLTLILGLSNSVWFDGFGKNRDARIGGTLGVRYGHF